MKRIYLTILSLFLMVSVSHAGLVSRYFTYAPTSTVTDTNLNGNFDNIVNTLNGGLTGANTDSANGWRFIEILSSPPAAGNQGRVFFDTSTNTLQFDTGSSFITTAVLPNNQTFTGTNTFNGTTNLNGTFTAYGTTNNIGNGGSDALTLNLPGGLSSSAMTWTLSGALTISGTIANLGIVTTADINGGTLDNVQIGGTTATGELIVNDANDYADGLGSQGTSGQFLMSQGAGVNPTWVPAHSKVFTSSDTFTAPTGVTKVYLSMVGGGGGGGTGASNVDGAGGGGGAALINYPFTVTPGNSYTVTIGTGGTGNTVAGTATSFDTVSVDGGIGANFTAAGSGGSGGYSASGTTAGGSKIAGGTGGSIPGGGGGGGTAFGSGANGRADGSGEANGNNASANTGGGGGGAQSQGGWVAGGNGGSGLCIVMY